MSIENAEQFLKDALHHAEIRDAFSDSQSPQQFLTIAQELGYHFSTEELQSVVAQHSEGVNIRRRTGIWQWLRTVPWIERQEAHP
ncbi:Nif11-like leader peptide family natural product precursor [Geitlerinema sp. P-1104]|uniref:Nif11-like leader peptide family natural product precursor n=1 Tax=Geitlerinema sp. P-1104 TaxID=2546230 RepID=UPI0014772CDB|nr:Nif11-like leader peptide family natural product precursor [Geitlerinema sp. P-1104]NMG57274.1 Nif11-like leader peptide family natural product precursor [Geitlerinema sp. P-1104]